MSEKTWDQWWHSMPSYSKREAWRLWLGEIQAAERQRIYNTFRCHSCNGTRTLLLMDQNEFGICGACGGTGLIEPIETWSDFERRLDESRQETTEE